ncbi:MAG: hypothetical protein RIT81_14320 [Deltaproteobacteria bacterium]
MLYLAAALLIGAAPGGDAINAVLGDSSWIAAHGGAPVTASSEERIVVHLAYVEAKLRSRDTSTLTPAQRKRRAHLLDVLATYRSDGVFPRRGVDGYVGRRPRFIDDRGVHCAVGHLIKASGHAALARSIDEDFEYAYVAQMDAPELLDWARAHGFTVEELAMIQPGYSPVPTEAMTRAALFGSADALTLRCAREHRPPRSVRVRVTGLPDASADVSSQSLDPFTACFVEEASRIERGRGAYDQPIQTYAFETRIPIRPPQRILEDRVARIRLSSSNTSCTPRPGALVREVRFDVRVGSKGVEANVTTTPANAEVSTCLAEYLEQGLRNFGPGAWRLRVQGERQIAPRVGSKWFRGRLQNAADNAALRCRTTDDAFAVTISGFGRVGDPQFTLDIESDDEALVACMNTEMQKHLRRALAVSRKKSDGTVERYVRIDAAATAKVTVEVRSKADLERRAKEALERREREKSMMH